MSRTIIKLTQEQRDVIDARVLLSLNKKRPLENCEIVAAVQPYLNDQLPKRDDFFRYVDASIQRLRGAGRIRTAKDTLGGGRGGWLLR